MLKSNEAFLSNKNVKIYSDNKNVSSILLKGSNKSTLQKLAMNVHQFCADKDIKISSAWISRSNNALVLADKFSRTFDNDDWEIKTWVFHQLNEIWGKFTIDRFASNLNRKCVRFNSIYWCVGTSGVDAMAQEWSRELNWWVPPPKMITGCINKIIADKARGTLILPMWKSAPFWPLVCKENVFSDFVRDIRVLPEQNVIVSGQGNNGVFASEPLKFKLLALKIEF